MEYKQLKAFRMVAQTLSFTHAATRLRYAQSTVTAQIKGLESELRVPLFDRRGGRVTLTVFGERLLPYAENLLRLSEEARRAIRHDGKLFGKLTVGAGEVITTYRLPGLIESFHHRYPDVYLALQPFNHNASSNPRTPDIGEADVILLHGTRWAIEGLCTQVIGDEEMALVVGAGHPLVGRRTVTPTDLADLRSIVTGPDCVYAQLYDAELGQQGVRAAGKLEFGTIEAVKRAVAAGLGASLMPRVAVGDLVAAGELAILPWHNTISLRTYAAWPEPRGEAPTVRAFVALVARDVGGEATDEGHRAKSDVMMAAASTTG